LCQTSIVEVWSLDHANSPKDLGFYQCIILWGAGKRVLGVLLKSYAMRGIANSVNLIGRPYRFCTNS